MPPLLVLSISRRHAALAILSLAAMLGAQARMHGLSPVVREPFELREERTSGKLERWTVRAESAVVPPDWVGMLRPGHHSPALGAADPVGVVRLRLELKVRADDEKPPGLCPGARYLEILRAPAGSDEFRPVCRFDPEQMQKALPEKWHAEVPGEDVQRRFYRVQYLDGDVVHGDRYAYRVQFLDGDNKAVAASLASETRFFEVPEVFLEVNAEGRMEACWELPALSASGTGEEVATILRTGKLHEFARTGPGIGRCRLPSSVGDPGVQLVLKAWTYTQAWDSEKGLVRWFDEVELSSLVQKPQRSRPALQVESFESPFAFADRQGGVRIQGEREQGEGLTIRASNVHGEPIPETLTSSFRSVVLAPGYSERLHIDFVRPARWVMELPRTNRVSAVRPPLCTSFRAEAKEDSVRLVWNASDYDEADWASGPFVEIRRVDATDVPPESVDAVRRRNPRLARSSRMPSSEFESIPRVRLVARVPMGECEYVDTTVTRGNGYLYTADVSGAFRASVWARGISDYSCTVPVLVEWPANLSHLPLGLIPKVDRRYFPVVAVPGPIRPLRTAFLFEDDLSAREQHLGVELVRMVGKERWIRLVEREQVDSLLLENEVRQLGGNEEDSRATVADIHLHFKKRYQGRARYLDVWLVDAANACIERVAALDLVNELNLPRDAGAVIARLAEVFPVQARADEGLSDRASDEARVIAIASAQPRSHAATDWMPPSGLIDMLTQELGNRSGIDVVDRLVLDEALKELNMQGTADPDRALALGRLLDADVIVAVEYGADPLQVTLAGRLVASRTGEVLRWIETAGAPEDVDRLIRDLARMVSEGAISTPGSGDNAALREREASLFRAPKAGVQERRTAHFIAPEEASICLELAQSQENNQQFDVAGDTYALGYTLALKAGDDSWPFLEGRARCLARSGRSEEEFAWWQAGLSTVADRPVQRSYLHVRLASIHLERGEEKEALEAFGQVSVSSTAAARLAEQLGDASRAARMYMEVAKSPQTIEKDIFIVGQVIRLSQFDLNPETLGLIARAWLPEYGERWPVQARMLFARLPASVKSDPNVSAKAAQIAVTLQDREWLRQLGDPAETTPTCGVPAGRGRPRWQKTRSLGDYEFTLSMGGSLIARAPGTDPVWTYPVYSEVNIEDRILGERKAGGRWRMGRWWGCADEDVFGQMVVDALQLQDEFLLVSACGNGALVALEYRTGRRLWEFDGLFLLTPPLVHQDKVFVGDPFGGITCLDLRSGTVLHRATYSPKEDHWPGKRVAWVCLSLTKDSLGIDHPAAPGVVFDLAHMESRPLHEFGVWVPPTRTGRLSQLRSDDPAQVRAVLLAIQKSGDVPTPELQAFVESGSDFGCVSLALDLLLQERGSALVPWFRDVLPRVPPLTQSHIIDRIEELGDASCVDLLEPFYLSENYELERKSTAALIEIGGEADMRRALGILEEGQRAATEAYNKKHDTNFLPTLWGASKRGYRVRLALARNGDQEAIRWLKADNKWQDQKARENLLLALCEGGDDEALDRLLHILSDESSWHVPMTELREWGLSQSRALKIIQKHAPDPRFVPFVMETARQGYLQEAGVAVLQRIGAPGTVPILLDMLQQESSSEVPNGDLIIAVTKALQSLTGRNFGTNSGAWDLWWREQTRVECTDGGDGGVDVKAIDE